MTPSTAAESTPAGGRGRIALALFAILIPVALTYAWNVWRNVESLGRVERACERIRAARASRWAALEEPARGLFDEDLPEVRELFTSMGEETCVEVPRAIGSPVAWRWSTTWQGEPWPAERLARLAEITERARARCPAMMEPFLEALGEDDPERRARAAREGCDEMMRGFDGYTSAPREASEPVRVWDWPAQLEHLAATLESVPTS